MIIFIRISPAVVVAVALAVVLGHSGGIGAEVFAVALTLLVAAVLAAAVTGVYLVRRARADKLFPARSRPYTSGGLPLDPACLPALAVIGRAALPPLLLEQVRRLERGELDEAAAEAVRGQLQAMAGIVYYATPSVRA